MKQGRRSSHGWWCVRSDGNDNVVNLWGDELTSFGDLIRQNVCMKQGCPVTIIRWDMYENVWPFRCWRPQNMTHYWFAKRVCCIFGHCSCICYCSTLWCQKQCWQKQWQVRQVCLIGHHGRGTLLKKKTNVVFLSKLMGSACWQLDDIACIRDSVIFGEKNYRMPYDKWHVQKLYTTFLDRQNFTGTLQQVNSRSSTAWCNALGKEKI